MNILALDPADVTGWAWGDGTRIQFGTWRLRQAAQEHDGRRLIRLSTFIMETAHRLGCNKIAFEDAGFGSINRHTESMHNELRGVIKRCAAELQIPFIGFHPTSIKKFGTGYGRADKRQMIMAAEQHFEIKVANDNEADALFVLAMAQQEYKVAERLRAAPKRRAKDKRLF